MLFYCSAKLEQEEGKEISLLWHLMEGEVNRMTFTNRFDKVDGFFSLCELIAHVGI